MLTPLSLLPRDNAGSDSRRFGRVQTQYIQCTIGEVIDLSGSGMRVLSKRRPSLPTDRAVPITLNTLSGPVLVRVKKVWSVKRGFRRWETGVQFVQLDDGARQCLNDTARASVRNEIVMPTRLREERAA